MRKWQETIKPWPTLSTHTSYRVQVSDIEKVTKDKAIRVTVEFQGKQMQSRRLSFRLPLPLRPDGIAADFFRACGIYIGTGLKISPRGTIGKMLKMRFEKGVDDKYQPAHFEVVGPKDFFESTEHQSGVQTGLI